MGKTKYAGVSDHGQNIRISFTYKGRRYRPVIPWKQTPENYSKASKLYLEVKDLIKKGVMTDRLLAEYFPEFRNQTHSTVPIFSEVAQKYLDTTGVSVNTRNEYKNTLNRYWMPDLAPKPINEILPSELKTILAGIAWSSPKTRNNAVSVLRQVFEVAYDDEVIDYNPADRIKPAKHQKTPPDPFTEAESARIISEMYKRFQGKEAVYAAYFEFAFWTGMRTSEMMALTWDDIDWYSKTVRVCKAQTKGRLNDQTKTAKIRDVMLTDQALHALDVMKPLTYLGQSHVFKSPRTGESWKTDKSPRAPFEQTLRKLGIRKRKAYNTRHTYATIMLMRGINPAFAASQLGHSLQMFLQVYAKWIDGDQNKSEFQKLKSVPTLAQSDIDNNDRSIKSTS